MPVDFGSAIGFSTLQEDWLLSFSFLPLAAEITEGEAGREDFFSSPLVLSNLSAKGERHLTR